MMKFKCGQPSDRLGHIIFFKWDVMETYFTRVLKIKRVLFCLLYSEFLPFYFHFNTVCVYRYSVKQEHVFVFANYLSDFLIQFIVFWSCLFWYI